MWQFFFTGLLMLTLSVLSLSATSAADLLKPGVHNLTDENLGSIIVSVPPKAEASEPLPILFLLQSQGTPKVAEWQEWADYRGIAVVGVANMDVTDVDAVGKRYKALEKFLKNVLLMHDFLRIVACDSSMAQTAMHIATNAGDKFAGIMMDRPMTGLTSFEKLRPDIPVVIIRNPDDTADMITKMIDAGKYVRTVSVKDLKGQLPIGIARRCMDYTFNLARVLNKNFTARERAANLEEIAKQIHELPGIADDETRLLYAQYLMAVPGMEKRRNDNERLADIWLDGATKLALSKEKEDKVEGHEWLSGIMKSPAYKEASGKYQKIAHTELTRMRRDPVIKKEMYAADLLAGAINMLERDQSTAKIKIVIKELESMIAQYPASNAAKQGAKALEKLKGALP
jgi:hypothetical protein